MNQSVIMDHMKLIQDQESLLQLFVKLILFARQFGPKLVIPHSSFKKFCFI